jgi:type I restriction enzyme S subunit
MGDVAEVVGGATPKSTNPANFGVNGIPWITPADLSGFTAVWIERGARSLTQAGYDSCSARLVPRGTVLMSSRAPIGYVAIAANELCTNQGFKSFVLPAELDPQFIYYWIRAIRDEIEHMGSGSTFLEVSRSRCREIPLVIAPHAEQKRIVAKVEELLARVNNARERLARVPAILKRFRQSVLAAACSGRLTADWREKQDTVHTGRTTMWQERPLRELLREPLRNGHSAKASTDGKGVRTLTLSAVTYSDFSERNTKITVADPARVCDLWLEEGDILIERSNTPELVGTAAMYRGPKEWAIFPDLLIRVRLLESIDKDFVEFFLHSEQARAYFRHAAQGTAGSMPKIDQRTIEGLIVPLPTFPEQHEIVRRVETLFTLADAIEKRVATATQRAEKLTQAILAKAFRGELVPTEAELARQEGRDYEPAYVLLERIRAERAGASAPPKRLRRRQKR